MQSLPNIRRRKWKLEPDPSQVICRPHIPDNPARIHNIISRVMSLSDSEAQDLLDHILLDFSDRHRDIRRILNNSYELVIGYLQEGDRPNEVQRMLIGSYFTMEYAVASAALFNPSMVPHPDQTGIENGSLRFIMSLRGIGEGHISSIVFRSGVVDQGGGMRFDAQSDYVEAPERRLDASYDKHLFKLKLLEMQVANEVSAYLLASLPEHFTFLQLHQQIDQLPYNEEFSEITKQTIAAIDMLANANYELTFHSESRIGERIIFPTSPSERSGIEDARFVQFFDDDGKVTYYATYTAYDGMHILPQMIETADFEHFNIITLNGKAAQNKGMALFPRKVNGNYAMLSRQDGENNYIMFSDDLHFWQSADLIQEPREPWEFIQLGNCGSPLETEAGWLVLTHGVGPMREYSIGAILLDLDDPRKVIGRLRQPLLSPHAGEREGYVPNVVYSCGGLIHNDELLLPYAMSDISSGMVSVRIKDLLTGMLNQP